MSLLLLLSTVHIIVAQPNIIVTTDCETIFSIGTAQDVCENCLDSRGCSNIYCVDTMSCQSSSQRCNNTITSATNCNSLGSGQDAESVTGGSLAPSCTLASTCPDCSGMQCAWCVSTSTCFRGSSSCDNFVIGTCPPSATSSPSTVAKALSTFGQNADTQAITMTTNAPMPTLITATARPATFYSSTTATTAATTTTTRESKNAAITPMNPIPVSAASTDRAAFVGATTTTPPLPSAPAQTSSTVDVQTLPSDVSGSVPKTLSVSAAHASATETPTATTITRTQEPRTTANVSSTLLASSVTQSSSSWSSALIIGVAVGVGVCLLLLCLIAIVVLRRRTSSSQQSIADNEKAINDVCDSTHGIHTTFVSVRDVQPVPTQYEHLPPVSLARSPYDVVAPSAPPPYAAAKAGVVPSNYDSLASPLQ